MIAGLLRPRFLAESFAISLRFCRAFIAHAVMTVTTSIAREHSAEPKTSANKTPKETQ